MHKKSFYIILLLTVTFALIYSCKKDEILEGKVGSYINFYPIDSAYWIEYQVDSIVHLNSDDIYLVDTSIVAYHFFIREEIDSSFIDGEGEMAYIVSRYKRDSDSLPWNFTSLWTSKLSQTSLERVEDNRRYVRLSFPFNPLHKWNGNAYNELPEEEYSYDEIYSPGSFNTMEFDSTVTVNQNEFLSNINRIVRKEIYGNHVGLLYKQSDSVGVAFTVNGQIILSGTEYKQTVVNYKH